MKKYTSRELINIVKNDGWMLARVEGSHHIFKHEVKKGIVTIPHPRKDIPVKTIKSILTQAGINITTL